MDRQILRQLFRKQIVLIYEFPGGFLYCFVFNLKKKSRRKSKDLQSTVEYLTE
jgi:hypothetical protein